MPTMPTVTDPLSDDEEPFYLDFFRDRIWNDYVSMPAKLKRDVEMCVRRGAQWMDENFPGWLDRIDFDQFDMTAPDECVCGLGIPSAAQVRIEEKARLSSSALLSTVRVVSGYDAFLVLYRMENRCGTARADAAAEDFGFSTSEDKDHPWSFRVLDQVWREFISGWREESWTWPEPKPLSS